MRRTFSQEATPSTPITTASWRLRMNTSITPRYVGKGRWKIYGVDLPDEVLEKIYYRNAIKLVPELEPMIAAD